MKNTQRCLALILSVLLVLSTIPVSVFALELNAVVFAGGDGTVNNPYQVSTPEQLNAVRNNLSASYVLINDIDLNNWGNWEPIGVGDSFYGYAPPADPPRSDYQPFTGEFDGNNHTIRNLKINDYEVSYVSDCHGLFAAVDGGVIKNLKLVDISITINKSSTDYAQILEEHRGIYAVYVGGIVGEATDTKIDNCYVSGSINVTHCDDAFVGGISGNGVVTDCVSNVSISVNNVTSVWCGGIVGSTPAVNSKISKCINYGNIKSYSSGSVSVGGIIGDDGLVSDCVNFGNIEGKVVKTDSSSGGPSSFAGACNVGGIVGATSSDYVKNSVNYGCVSAYLDCTGISNYANTYSQAYAGGIAGYCGYYSSGFINQCYNLSKSISCVKISNTGVTSTQNAGRISGYSRKNSNCYSVVSTSVNNTTISSAQNTTNDGQDIGKEDCLIEKTYINFDFENTWKIDEIIGGAILKLRFDDIISDNPIKPGSSLEQLYFIEPIVILDIGESKSLSVHSRDVANVNGELVYSNDKVVNASDIDWNAELYEDSGIIKIDDNGQITGLSEGYEHISINSKDDLNLSTFCHVYVGDPNDLHYTSTYDTKQYYADGGFYSEVSSISDCVEIYILFENKLKEAVANISGIDEAIAKDIEKLTFKDTKPITLTASVNGTGLSFDRDTYQNTYTVTLDAISLAQAVDDILMLFPYNLNVASSGNNYTVTVTLESESFETITDEYSFTVENIETKSANEHIDFLSSNKDYNVSKQNIYGETMVTLKTGDYRWYEDEYNWSKYSTFDFENYYEVVFADILIELMNTSQLGHVSLLPVVKEWVGNYKTILSEVSTIVEDDYTGYLNVTENAIDKVLKKSKYTTEGMDVHDEISDFVVLKLRDKVSIDKVNSAFAAIDKTQQYFSFFELSVDITNDIADFIDGVSVLNAYKEMDNEFKAVIQNLYSHIPSSNKKLKDAVYHYVNVDSYLGYSSEILNEVRDMAGDITLDVFNTLFKKQVVSSICNAIGNITLKSGALLSSTTAFSTISTGLGAVTTGATLGLCISDILCDSSGKSEEMSKVVAMSEFSPYVINTLNHYESKLYADRNDAAVTYYEYAFAMHKATQRYIMQHTVNSLEIKRDSLIIKLFGRDDYDGLINDILVQKRAVDNLECHNTNPASSVATETKIIAIKCPVNVFVYDESGKEVVRIVNDIKEYVSDGIDVFVENSEKYVALPTDQKYSVKIIATDSGTMEYTVTEYGTGAERLRTIKKDNIPLVNNREFTGQIVTPMNVAPESYALTYDNHTVVADNIVNVPVTGVQMDFDNITINIGETKKLSATVNPNNASNKDVTWSSDNPNVVEIDKDGNITALATGVATITVSSEDWGFIDTCIITVSCSHTPANVWSTDSEYHWKECTIVGCGIVIDASKAAHTPDHQGNATEEYAIKCSVCGYIIEAQLNHTHLFDKEVAEEQYISSKANCTEPAKYYKSCKCGEKGTETFTSGEALGHTEGTEWKSDKDNHWHECSVAGCGVIIDNGKATHTPDRDAATETNPIKCSVCGYVITPAFGHTHAHGAEWKSDKDDHWNECTCGDKANTAAHNDANIDGKCDVCEYEVGTVTPDPDNKPDDTAKPSDDVQSPQTGYNSMMWLWVALLVVSGFGMIATIVMRKKFVR